MPDKIVTNTWSHVGPTVRDVVCLTVFMTLSGVFGSVGVVA